METDFKHIDITTRGGISDGRVCYTFPGSTQMFWGAHISRSEAEILQNLNNQIRDMAKRLEALKAGED